LSYSFKYEKIVLRQLLLLVFVMVSTAYARAVVPFASPQSQVLTDSLTDTLKVSLQDSIRFNLNDSLATQALQTGDTSQIIKEIKPKKESIDAKVERAAMDSIIQDLPNRKVYLYGDAQIVYGDITLKAAYIEVDFVKNEVFARGVTDSTGKLKGTPVFTEGGQTFESEQMNYNFDTKKGLIYKVFTQDGQGYLHGSTVKKMPDNRVNIRSGSYTTCNHKDHPHFEFRFRKSKVIPDDKIITGPAYMVIEGVPTPLALPFGLFPNKSGQRSGIRIPTYGESANRGFYFENGGYYWAINQYMDLDLLGDIYTRGSWAVKPTFRYKKRYKYDGSLNTSYAINITGSEGAPDYQRSRDFRVRWTHRQDAKARPAGKFSADVFIVSSNFNKFNPVSAENYLSNEFKSSVAYQTNWNNKYFLTLNGSHRQNTKTKMVDVNLPELTFTVNRFYPLKRKESLGKPRWYEELNVNYTLNARNSLSLPDSMLLQPDALSKMQNGIQQSLPLNLPIKLLKYFTLANSVNITDRIYFDYRRKSWEDDPNDTLPGQVRVDTLPGIKNVLDFSFSSNLSTKMYGMIAFKKGPVRAIRHVITPRVGFTYTPKFSDPFWGYYDSFIDGEGIEQFYSKYEGAIYGSPPKDKSGRITFGISNNLEIKIPSRKDTISGLRKVVLIEDLSINGSYDLARDSLRLSDITMRGRTRLLKNLNLQYSGSWDAYALDSAGRQINQFEWDVNRRLLRRKQTTWDFGVNWSIGQKDFEKKKERTSKFGTEEELAEINENPEDYVDWEVPWNLSINYNFRYSNNPRYLGFVKTVDKKIVQTLGVSGEVNVAPKWKLTFNTGWDFETKALSYTSVNIYRDLHCWEMRFSWIPMGFRKSWNFTINVKASVLQDLKLNKKKDFRDL
jgi:lipopolysaccharide assembly outer membrane protein LptD (OstA)